MSTNIRNEVSKKSKFYIPKHRHLELVHFVRQYPMWVKNSLHLEKLKSKPWVKSTKLSNGQTYSRTEAIAILEAERKWKIEIVNESVKDAARDSDIAKLLMEGVTTGKSYEKMRATSGGVLVCSQNEYYEAYRYFFWILDKKRG